MQLFDAATNDQLNNAVDLTVNAVYQYPTSDLFVTGHSLGGFNAQFIGYALAEGLIGDSDNEGWLDNKLLTKKEKVWKLLNENNLYQRTATFNAAPFFNRLISAVDFDIASSNKYDNKILNYQISYDPLYIGGKRLNGTWNGKEMKPFLYKARKNNKVVSLEESNFPKINKLGDLIDAGEEALDYSFNAHGIIQFHLHEFEQ